jgi:F-type H+-transporting ATPase subunit b
MTPSTVLLGAAAGTLVAQVATTILAFFIVLWVLHKFAWKPALKVIDDRRDTITREFETISSRQAKLESQIKDYEERLRQIDNEARERQNKAIEEGRRTATELLEQARRQAEEIRRKAEGDIRIEIEKARVDLRDVMTRMTIEATRRFIREQLDEERHTALIGSVLDELAAKEQSR